jgi:hypothetical protein
MYCVFLGRATATNAPSAGSVGASQLANNIISGQTALGATPADTDEFLVSDAGTLKRVDYSYIKGLANWSESSGNLLPSDASYGIYLGVNSATAANLLDDYEEGTFTPTFASGITSVGYSTQGGTYTKIGNRVILSFQLTTNSGTANSSGLTIGGLPFTINGGGTGSGGAGIIGYTDNALVNSETTNLPTVYGNTSTFQFYNTAGGTFVGTDLADADSLNMHITCVYRTA